MDKPEDAQAVGGNQVAKLSPEEAQEMFDTLMDFGTNHLDIPEDVLLALDYVADYCGDIAHGREYKPSYKLTMEDA